MKRLVPMPGAKAPPLPPQPAPAPMVPTFRNSWSHFAFLIVTAIVMYYAKWPILFVAGMIGFFRGLFWLCERYPRTMLVIAALVRGLMSGRR